MKLRGDIKMIDVKVIKDSINLDSDRLTTLACTYPRYIHSELMTHRMFSRNASSSRAIPIDKMIEEAETNMVDPMFMYNQRGMAASKSLVGRDLLEARREWEIARDSAVESASYLAGINVHKQIVNRLLEPFIHITTLITATEWDNFFNLRISDFAQQEINHLAIMMREAMRVSKPNVLVKYEWHLPFVQPTDMLHFDSKTVKKLSVARCARVSYLNHDNTTPNRDSDVALHDMLKERRHASPFEHVATPKPDWHANFFGWRQYRSELNV